MGPTIKLIWLHAPLRNFDRNEQGGSNTASSFLYAYMDRTSGGTAIANELIAQGVYDIL